MMTQRGLIGIGIFIVGIAMLFPEQTHTAAYLVLGFGMGMIISGFQNEKKKR